MSDRSACLHFDEPDQPAVYSTEGMALGLSGFAAGAAGLPRRVRLRLVQGDHAVDAGRVHVETGLLRSSQRTGTDELDCAFYISAAFPPCTGIDDGPARIEAVVDRAGDAAIRVEIGTVRVCRVQRVALPWTGAGPCVAIAMATYNPDAVLFARQIASIKCQSHTNWLCVISDDGSTPACLRTIRETIAGDRRFVLIPPGPNLGFYRNFERACAAVPLACAFVAFSDQDDRWFPDRLAKQIAAVADDGFACSYSDLEIVSREGRLISPTFWTSRRREFGNVLGLLLANVVTGMTLLAGGKLIASALPFPAAPGQTYHDHWIALVAEKRGRLRYVPEPLVQYVQHGDNHTGMTARYPGFSTVLGRALPELRRALAIGLRDRQPSRAICAPMLLHWLDTEPARLRILADRLRAVPAEDRSGDRALARLGSVGVLSLAFSGAGWRDRYRRNHVLKLWLGALLRCLVVAALRARGHGRHRLAR